MSTRSDQAQGQQVGFDYAVDAMLEWGFSRDEIGKAGGGNFLRAFDAATASPRCRRGSAAAEASQGCLEASE